MDNPQIPLATVNFLAEATEERLEVNSKPNTKIVTLIVQYGQETRSIRIEITNDIQWGNVSETAAKLFIKGKPADSAAIFYPTDDEKTLVDLGLLLRPNEVPLGLLWTFGPRFAIHLAPQESADQISTGAGVAVLQGMLDASKRIIN